MLEASACVLRDHCTVALGRDRGSGIWKGCDSLCLHKQLIKKDRVEPSEVWK